MDNDGEDSLGWSEITERGRFPRFRVLSESACLTKSLELPEPFPDLQTRFCRFGQLRRMVLNLSANDRESTHPARFAAISILAN